MTVDVDEHSEAVSLTDLHAGGSDGVLKVSEPVPEAVRTPPGPAEDTYVYRTRETGRLPPRHRLQPTATKSAPHENNHGRFGNGEFVAGKSKAGSSTLVACIY